MVVFHCGRCVRFGCRREILDILDVVQICMCAKSAQTACKWCLEFFYMGVFLFITETLSSSVIRGREHHKWITLSVTDMGGISQISLWGSWFYFLCSETHSSWFAWTHAYSDAHNINGLIHQKTPLRYFQICLCSFAEYKGRYL